MTRVERAVVEAKRIRKNLLRLRHPYVLSPRFGQGLAGACGLASILLSIDLNDVSILRGRCGHVWTVVDRHIIDITATQFATYGTYDVGSIKGVLVTRTPKSIHKPIEHEGLKTYLEVVNHNWYTKLDYGKWKQLADYWL